MLIQHFAPGRIFILYCNDVKFIIDFFKLTMKNVFASSLIISFSDVPTIFSLFKIKNPIAKLSRMPQVSVTSFV